MRKRKEKKIKLPSIPRINRRLLKKWSEIVRNNAGNKCEYCGKSAQEIGKVDAHHLQSRKIKNNPLKFDTRNSVCVCPLHHKFSCNESFHKAPVVTMNWLINNHPERFNYVLEHFDDTVDLQNREVLKEIEKCLDEKKPLDINKLKEIEKQFPRAVKNRSSKKNLLDDLLNNDEDEKNSSSESA